MANGYASINIKNNNDWRAGKFYILAYYLDLTQENSSPVQSPLKILNAKQSTELDFQYTPEIGRPLLTLTKIETWTYNSAQSRANKNQQTIRITKDNCKLEFKGDSYIITDKN